MYSDVHVKINACIARAGHFRYFFYFFNNKKIIFASFIKLIWPGVGFLNRTGAEIGY